MYVGCSWLLPTAVKDIPYAPVTDIDVLSAKKLNQKMDQNINDLTTSKEIATTPEAVEDSQIKKWSVKSAKRSCLLLSILAKIFITG